MPHHRLALTGQRIRKIRSFHNQTPIPGSSAGKDYFTRRITASIWVMSMKAS